jgi:broad specificity phosphatase PhoE
MTVSMIWNCVLSRPFSGGMASSGASHMYNRSNTSTGSRASLSLCFALAVSSVLPEHTASFSSKAAAASMPMEQAPTPKTFAKKNAQVSADLHNTDFSTAERQRYVDGNIMGMAGKRLVAIRGTRLVRPSGTINNDGTILSNTSTNSPTTNNDNDGTSSTSGTSTIKKTVHFQRHGQGYHNLLFDIWRANGLPSPNISEWESIENVPDQHPMIRSEIVDSPLTALGRQQCLDRRQEASTIQPEIIVVSPLTRAIQTAQLTFDAHWDKSASGGGGKNDDGETISSSRVPWVAHEDCREETGLFVCNQRRPISEMQPDFPFVDFSQVPTDHDAMFIRERREHLTQQNDRIYSFLVDYLMQLPQKEIVVVGHSSWLFHMCNAVLDCDEEGDESLTSWFGTSEIRSLQLEFSSKEE